MATVVDASINFRGKLKLPFYQSELRRAARERAGTPYTAERLIPALDDAGVDKAVLIASVAAVGVGGEIDGIHVDEVYPEIQKAPDRIFGYAGINPLEDIKTNLAYINYAVNELDFRGVHIYPHWFGMRIDDKKYYPIYAKCAELGVPIMLQVGHPTPRNRAKVAAHPLWLDDIAYDFPELTILGIHIGSPWVDDMMMMCRGYENVYMVADAHQPSTWEPQLIEYINGGGRRNLDGWEKVIWGSDWPIQDIKEALGEVRALNLNERALEHVLGLNAMRVMNLG
jgi:Predicted metal-dependent hydrolase of the TIM-barrel fold